MSFRAPEASAPAPATRSLALTATVGGVVAAVIPLLVCAAVGVVGWFATDGGVHGSPSDGMRAAALAWLMAHGSGVHVQGAAVTAIPLGLTAFCAWVNWRVGLRVGEDLADHGPDAVRLSDGERDWTVPAGVTLYAAAYVVLGVVVGLTAGSKTTQPGLAPVVGWGLLLAGGVGGAALATGSGRAAVWLARVPLAARETIGLARRLVGALLALAGAFFVVALLVDLGAALSVFSRLHTGVGGSLVVVLLMLLAVPNALVWSASYLLGPGFLVGTETLVSPTVVAIGPVPLFPLLAALPDNGETPFWTPFVVVLPMLLAGFLAWRAHRARPTWEWETGAVRGLAAGVLAGVALGLLAAVAGGAVGPGRMAETGPAAGEVLFHAIVSLGIGGLLGGLASTWWVRRHGLPPEPEDEPADEAGQPDTEDTVKVTLPRETRLWRGRRDG